LLNSDTAGFLVCFADTRFAGFKIRPVSCALKQGESFDCVVILALTGDSSSMSNACACYVYTSSLVDFFAAGSGGSLWMRKGEVKRSPTGTRETGSAGILFIF